MGVLVGTVCIDFRSLANNTHTYTIAVSGVSSEVLDDEAWCKMSKTNYYVVNPEALDCWFGTPLSACSSSTLPYIYILIIIIYACFQGQRKAY
jgi:hypothetical protein